MWYWDSKPRTSEHQSPPISNRTGLPPNHHLQLPLNCCNYFNFNNSSVDSSVPTIIHSRVRIPSEQYMILFSQILCYICRCVEKRTKIYIWPVFTYFLKKDFTLTVEVSDLSVHQ